ncbi:MAG: carboxypeptidase regulatory-like domain-containing protein [Planctomycetes bacterium]|nr:carboxypeptidase regulatory-like domain-containing protein [Planctomycetota bacterium]
MRQRSLAATALLIAALLVWLAWFVSSAATWVDATQVADLREPRVDAVLEAELSAARDAERASDPASASSSDFETAKNADTERLAVPLPITETPEPFVVRRRPEPVELAETPREPLPIEIHVWSDGQPARGRDVRLELEVAREVNGDPQTEVLSFSSVTDSRGCALFPAERFTSAHVHVLGFSGPGVRETFRPPANEGRPRYYVQIGSASLDLRLLAPDGAALADVEVCVSQKLTSGRHNFGGSDFGAAHKTTTDASGRAVFDSLKSGAVTLYFTSKRGGADAPQYESEHVALAPGEHKYLELTLRVVPPPADPNAPPFVLIDVSGEPGKLSPEWLEAVRRLNRGDG